MKKGGFSTREIARASLGTVVIILCSWLCIPTAVPFTMQSFGVILISLALGRKCSLLSLLIYCLLGLCGIPVFAGFKSGAVALSGPTGGYILGLFMVPAVMGFFKTDKYRFVGAIGGLILMYAVGTLWYAFIYAKNGGVLSALSMCVVPFIVPDIIKCILAFVCARKIKQRIS